MGHSPLQFSKDFELFNESTLSIYESTFDNPRMDIVVDKAT